MKKFWGAVKNYQVLIATLLGSIALGAAGWKAFGDPVVCQIIERETVPIYRTLDYLIACNQAKMSSDEMARADSLYMVNQKWKALRSK